VLISIGANTDAALDWLSLGDEFLLKLWILIGTTRSSKWEAVFRRQNGTLLMNSLLFCRRPCSLTFNQRLSRLVCFHTIVKYILTLSVLVQDIFSFAVRHSQDFRNLILCKCTLLLWVIIHVDLGIRLCQCKYMSPSTLNPLSMDWKIIHLFTAC
jgi:hypothetical protein